MKGHTLQRDQAGRVWRIFYELPPGPLSKRRQTTVTFSASTVFSTVLVASGQGAPVVVVIVARPWDDHAGGADKAH